MTKIGRCHRCHRCHRHRFSEKTAIELSPLGEAIAKIWQTIGSHHPEVKVVALQMMPDHLHAILFVREKMEKPLGKVVLGLKQACNKAFRELMPVEFIAVPQQYTERKSAMGGNSAGRVLLNNV